MSVFTTSSEIDDIELPQFIGKICRLFNSIDSNGNELIERDEILLLGFTQEETEYLMVNMDVNSDETISCSEFIAYFLKVLIDFGKDRFIELLSSLEMRYDAKLESLVQTPTPTTELEFMSPRVVADKRVGTWLPRFCARVSTIFGRIDLDQNNRLSLEELKTLFSGDIRRASFMLREADDDENGDISPHEFFCYFMKTLKSCEPDMSRGKLALERLAAQLERKLNARDDEVGDNPCS